MTATVYSLSAIARRVQELLEPALGKTFWVKAEIHSGRERGGAFFCDLVETDEAGRICAQMRCTVWSSELLSIRRRFAEAGLELRLNDGTAVGLLCRLHYHVRYGLSLSVLDMDPAFALGELELRKRRILERLRSEGLLRLNAERPETFLPNCIALITSRGSAAFRDFVQTLLASEFGFRIYEFDASVQGDQAEAQICAALDAAVLLPVELVVIARGGGSRTDLASLDSEVIARRIAAYPLPVWTGIGHESDESVLDCVAARAFKTPTAVAEEIVARFRNAALQCAEASQRLRALWRWRSRREQERNARTRDGLRQGARKLLQLARSDWGAQRSALEARLRNRLAIQQSALEVQRRALEGRLVILLRGIRQQLVAAQVSLRKDAQRRLEALDREQRAFRVSLQWERVQRRLHSKHQDLLNWERLVRACDPQQALQRGFSLVYGPTGALLRSAAQVSVGDRIRTRLAQGNIESAV